MTKEKVIKRRSSELANQVSKSIKSKKRIAPPVEFLHSGSHVLNLVLSGKARNGGWARGRVCNIVGDGSSGKTLCALELAFYCFKNIKKIKSEIYSEVKKVSIVYNNCEGVMDFPLAKIYGQDFVDGVEWICIKTVEEMGRDYTRRINKLKKGEFLLYIVDSWDSLQSKAEQQRFREAIEKDKEMDGSYGLESQKHSGRLFANISGLLESNKKDSTLFIISQVRSKIGITFGKKTYRAGGKALDFYTHQVAWIAEVQKLTKTKKKHSRVYGIVSKAKVERSKVAKPFREGQFSILFDYGIDDIGTMIDFLYGKRSIKFDGKHFAAKDNLIKYIEGSKKESLLVDKLENEWASIEREFEKEIERRKPRFEKN